jgi:hypothetical protein
MNLIQQLKDSLPSLPDLFKDHRILTWHDLDGFGAIRDRFPNSILNEIFILQYQEAICGSIPNNQKIRQDLLDETKNVYNRLKQSKFNWIRNNLDLLAWYINK